MTFGKMKNIKNENYVMRNDISVDQKNHFKLIQYCLVESIASYMFSKNSSHCYSIILLHHTVASFFFICFVLLMHVFNFVLVLSNSEYLIPHLP